MKKLIPLIAVAVVIWIIYQKSPGLQSKANEIKNNWTEWSQEDIKANPVKFLEAREDNLRKVLGELEVNRGKIDSEVAKLRTARDEHQKKVDIADRLAGEFKAAYKAAQEGDSWPVTVKGKDYTRDELIKQVEGLMVDKGTHESIVADRAAQIERISGSEEKIKAQIAKVESSLQGIVANREKIKADMAIAASEKWLKEIDEQINAANVTVTEGSDPVRDLEEIAAYEEAEQQKEAMKAAEAAKKQKTIEFLEN